MFGVSSLELIIIALVALIVLGPEKLPGLARKGGKILAELRRMSTDFQRTINTEIEREDMDRRVKQAEKDLFADKTEAPKAEESPVAVEPAPSPTHGAASDTAYDSARDANAGAFLPSETPAEEALAPAPEPLAPARKPERPMRLLRLGRPKRPQGTQSRRQEHDKEESA